MTEPITSTGATPAAELLELTTSLLTEIEETWAEQRRIEEAAMRRGAVETAEEYVLRCFPHTLAQLFGEMSWQGYPDSGPDGPAFYTSAVAGLGDGLFLHYTRRKRYTDGSLDGWDEVLTLIRCCPCGNYPHTVVRDDHELAIVLQEVQPSNGCGGSCDPTSSEPDKKDC
ncbi:hypothetical protein [Streptomyces sp. NPDC059015]|uniref:hypothetical protein n=1 Tax=unclassified Streptomyces TaxID=2593676 RepID=UPI00367F9856